MKLPVQGVVFVLIDAERRVLMERCPKKKLRHGADWYIPGGRLEPMDNGDPLLALTREMLEELNCIPTDIQPLPVVDACGGPGYDSFLIQPYRVRDWQGDPPRTVGDHPEVPLAWISWFAAIGSPSPVVRAILASAWNPAREA